MTDLEMIKRCAEKVGLRLIDKNGVLHCADTGHKAHLPPPNDDARAMALLVWLGKRGRVEIEKDDFRFYRGKPWKLEAHAMLNEKRIGEALRKAIVECVAGVV